jgi:hypothetical protein
MAIPVARYLVEFGKGDSNPPFRAQHELVLPNAFETVEDGLERQVEEAFVRGLEKGREKAKEEFELELAAANSQLVEELAAERKSWVVEQSEALKDQMITSYGEFKNSIADSVARILTPFLTSALTKQVIDELIEVLSIMHSQKSVSTIRMSGPDDLIQALQEKLEGRNFNIECIPSQTKEVTIIADQTTVVTQLQAWIDRFNDSVR